MCLSHIHSKTRDGALILLQVYIFLLFQFAGQINGGSTVLATFNCYTLGLCKRSLRPPFFVTLDLLPCKPVKSTLDWDTNRIPSKNPGYGFAVKYPYGVLHLSHYKLDPKSRGTGKSIMQVGEFGAVVGVYPCIDDQFLFHLVIPMVIFFTIAGEKRNIW